MLPASVTIGSDGLEVLVQGEGCSSSGCSKGSTKSKVMAATCSLRVPHVNRPVGKERNCHIDRGSDPAYLEDSCCSITGAGKVCLEIPG